MTIKLKAESLAESLSGVELTGNVVFGQITPQRSRVITQVQLRVFELDLALDYQPEGSVDSVGLYVTLKSDPWQASQNWPPGLPQESQDVPVKIGVEVAASGDYLAYTLERIEQATLVKEAPWMCSAGLVCSEEAPSQSSAVSYDIDTTRSSPWLDSLQQALQAWLFEQQLVNVDGVMDWLAHAPVGYFGALTRRVLERTGQRDLEVDVSQLAHVRQPGLEHKPEVCLTLYGERFGRWILHRDSPKVTQIANKEGQHLVFHDNKEVLLAKGVDELIDIAGLGVLEKRLFKQANLLQPDCLHRRPANQAGSDLALAEVDQQDEPASVEQLLNLNQLEPRSRNTFNLLFKLAQQGHLSHLHLDLLGKVARQLCKAK